MLAAAASSAHVDDERAGKRQRVHEVRSRRGCLTCRRRKKKCPEDMVVRGDGLPSCSACHGRRERCEWASAGLGSDRTPVLPQEQPISTRQTVPPPTSPPLALPSEDGALVDGFLLDDFFRDYVGLSETLLAGFDPSDSFLSTPSSVISPSVAAREQGRPASAAPRRSERYDRIIRSDDLDGLLSKYSAMYESLWHAIVAARHAEDKGKLAGLLMGVAKSNKACRASTLAICLAYHELMRQLPRDKILPFTLTAALTDAPPLDDDGPGDESQSHPARAWLLYAVEEHRRAKRYGLATLEQRILCLLNLRWAMACIHGARRTRELMNEFKEEIMALGLDASYLLRTEKRGTVLSSLLQSIMIGEVFDAATIRGCRSIVSGGLDDVLDPASSIAQPRKEWEVDPSEDFDFDFYSRLSGALVLAVKVINDLGADVCDGIVRPGTAEAETRRQAIMAALARCSPCQMGEMGMAAVRVYILHEQWRQAVIIHLHQTLGYGPLSGPIRQALKDLLAMSTLLQNQESLHGGKDTWDMCMVWFLACTASVTSEERQKCIVKLEHLSHEQALKDNIEVIRLLWIHSDDVGHTVDWHEFVKERQLAVNYMF